MRERESYKIESSRRYPGFLRPKKGTMLIAGCGDGPQIAVFSPLVKKIVAVDIDDERIMLAKELVKVKGIRNCEIKRLSVYELEKLGRKFDSIVAIDIIEHVDDPRKALRSMKKVLAPGGKLLITFPNTFELYYSAGMWLNRNILRMKEKKGKHYDYHQTKLPPWKWLKMFRDAGFSIRRYDATTMAPPVDWFGVKPYWFTNDLLNVIDGAICKVPLLKLLGLSIMVVLDG